MCKGFFMEVQPINKVSFCAKNTFLTKAKNASNKMDKFMALSEHYEAKSRLHYMRYNKIQRELNGEEYTKNIFNLMRKVPRMVYEKLASVNCQIKSYNKCSERFK